MKTRKLIYLKKASRQKIIGVLSIVVLLISGSIVLLTGDNSRPTKATPAPITHDQAIPKAQEYLLGHLNSLDPTLRLMLDFLYRKFDINDKFSGQVVRIDTSAKDPLVEDELKAIARIAYKDSTTNSLGANPSLVAIAASCDYIPLPGNISTLLQQGISNGEFELTHAFLSMQFMKELGCNFDNADSLREQALEGMLKVLASDKDDLDLRYECLAFVMYAGKLERIDSVWIDEVYSAQHQDGGWSLDKKDPKSNDHPTVLALWALLEYNRSDVPYEPIIHPIKK